MLNYVRLVGGSMNIILFLGIVGISVLTIMY